MTAPQVRPATVDDVPAMARVHVAAWQETYRGLMADDVLDDPGFVARRERLWRAVLTDERYSSSRVAAVAEQDGELVGITMSGSPEDADGSWTRQLFVLYLLGAHHGSGAGAALLIRTCGVSTVQDGVREVRMVRGARSDADRAFE